MNKKKVIESIKKKYLKFFSIVEENIEKPWGAYWVIDNQDLKAFIKKFFENGKIIEEQSQKHNLSPKILLVEPSKRLSWQYHHYRSEYWKVLAGPIGVVRSQDDHEGEIKIHEVGEVIELGVEERHRIIGLENWGVIAEIWKHTNHEKPSNEDDIVRVQDDFGR